MRQISLIVFALSLYWPLSVAAKITIITTTEDVASIVHEIGGNQVNVSSLIQGNRDPHYAQAKPSMIRQLSRADLLFVIGADMEVGWLPAALRNARNPRIQAGQEAYIDLSRSVDLIGVVTTSVSRADGDVHAKGNPHYWLNPLNGLKMAQVITDTLSQHSPQHSTFFASQLLQFNTKLQTAYAQWQTQLSFLQGKKIMTYHTSLDYLAQAFGFSIVAQLEPKPGIAPTAAHLRGLIKTIKQENIHYLLMEQFYEQGSAKLLQRQTDIRVIRIPQSVGANTEINTYTELFESIVSRFQEAH